MVIRVAVPIEYKNEQALSSRNVLDLAVIYPSRNLILYYPNNSFVQSIVARGIEFMKQKNSLFNPISKF